ncbi:putative hemolysin [Yersinia rohdei]|nr:putative hemolysin [Yersinia rohdei]
MSVNHTLPDGRNIKIHYQYNSFTNKAYDMKVITPQRPGAAYKEKQ